MSSPHVDIVDTNALNEFDINLLSPLSIFSLDEHLEKQQVEWPTAEQPECVPDAQVTKSASKSKAKTARSGPQKQPTLACLNCRPKKIKCQWESNACKRCTRLGLNCVVPEGDERRRPCSKTHIRELEQRIRTLERDLRKAREALVQKASETPQKTAESPTEATKEGQSTEERGSVGFSRPSAITTLPEIPRSLIARLCARQSHLNTDELGQLRFFGPTSSLHTAESVCSSFVHWGDFTTKNDGHLNNDIPPRLQEYLLDQYWKYQHTVLQVIHKEAFLHDMRTGQCRYFSKALLYSIFACAARISDIPDVRALTISIAEGTDREEPYLFRKATTLLEEELEHAGITTIQALQLLSVIHCARSADTKGWMESGRAIRLVFELGLHKDASELESTNLSQMDLEVRQVVFWGCFTFDRMWALYLGRPYSIKLDDVSVLRPGCNTEGPSWDMLMSAAWSSLLDIVGHVCDALNGNSCTSDHVTSMNQQLLAWEAHLDETIQYFPECPPSACVLHMQYCSATILLHRPAARFGIALTNASSASLEARAICVLNATRIIHMVQDYRQHHGIASTMLGTALYNVTIAGIVLIANMADDTSRVGSHHLLCIDTCIRGLEEMELSSIVAGKVLKQLRYLMRRCNLRFVPLNAQAPRNPMNPTYQSSINEHHSPTGAMGQGLPTLTVPDTDASSPHDFLQVMTECDALNSMGSWDWQL
ncbi:MAG: hypothetical protein M1830_001051 [Pleopsidium flavum]|nr:MAG: hypothetical protein M1830_001051 [Pleopsidium flavum]